MRQAWLLPPFLSLSLSLSRSLHCSSSSFNICNSSRSRSEEHTDSQHTHIHSQQQQSTLDSWLNHWIGSTFQAVTSILVAVEKWLEVSLDSVTTFSWQSAHLVNFTFFNSQDTTHSLARIQTHSLTNTRPESQRRHPPFTIHHPSIYTLTPPPPLPPLLLQPPPVLLLPPPAH